MTWLSMRTDARRRGPPWTTRCPTASIPCSSWIATASRASSTRLTLRELEPALRTRTRKRLARPGPVEDFGRVLTVVARVLSAAKSHVGHELAHVRGPGTQRRNAVDHVHHQVIAVEVVQHDHVEWRGRGSLFLVAADMEVVVVRPPVAEAVDQPRIAVVGEDHRPVLREDFV